MWVCLRGIGDSCICVCTRVCVFVRQRRIANNGRVLIKVCQKHVVRLCVCVCVCTCVCACVCACLKGQCWRPHIFLYLHIIHAWIGVIQN